MANCTLYIPFITDAKRFASGFSYFEPSDLENLNTGQAVVRIERPDYDFSISTIPLDEPTIDVATQRRQAAIDYSRTRYSTTKSEIEASFKIDESQLHTGEIEEELDLIAEEKVIVSKPSNTPQEKHKELTDDEIQNTKQRFVEQQQETEHRYIQNYIKKMAESRSYIARLEEPVGNGKERVDVHLERNGKSIACEVCVTTDIAWEVHNIDKCVQAGYDLVVDCSNDKKTIANLQEAVKKEFTKAEQKKILIVTPEELFTYIDTQIVKEASTETRIKGYRVKVEYNAIPENEMQQKKAAIGKTVLSSRKKKQ